MSELQLSFWEKAAVLERRLVDANKSFAEQVQKYAEFPEGGRVALDAAADQLLEASRARREHAGSARCEPIQTQGNAR